MSKRLNRLRQRPSLWLIGLACLLFSLLAACSQREEIIVEVTRVVTETEIVEAEDDAVEVEVTRVVTETVIETVEVEAESEEESEPPLATGSEDDSGPLPPEPDDGPKVTSRVTTPTSEDTETVALVTAVPPRASQNNTAVVSQPTSVTLTNDLNSNLLQKWCHQAITTRKKRCI